MITRTTTGGLSHQGWRPDHVLRSRRVEERGRDKWCGFLARAGWRLADRRDFADNVSGFIATLEPIVIDAQFSVQCRTS